MKWLKIKNRIFISAMSILSIAIFGTSCSKDNSTLPPVNGYNASNDVASSSLLAHWTFDGTNNETISGTAPSTSNGASFGTGIKGQGLSLNNGYILYPTIAALSSANALGSFTVSAWINTDNRDTLASSVFALTKTTSAQTDWNDGPINMYVETVKNHLTYDDTLVLHGAFATYPGGIRAGGDNINDYGVRGVDFQTVLGTKKWVHYVLRYDGAGSNIDIYANGTRVSNNNFRFRGAGTPAVGLGALVMPVPTQVLIGGWPSATTGFTNSAAQTWQGLFVGSIDEVRVYNKSLSDLEIGSLYQLELAGR
ncbi:LamG domain-containing protein [Ferruginibacter albus]|uniref:LamG domain-containing protein n=1 Tax=Ferruginibacter albus TaxID=2875540 RepID=UPI001CC3A12E|nr:LamG domain-containing protein [Ferruginibacter albus]UAY51561.1 LamG domain-containing protein [Ferruginibacter albus]